MTDVRLLLGDCLQLMADLPDRSIDAVIADLPYGLTNCRWDSVIPLDGFWAHARRLLKTNGVVVLTASQPFTSALVMSNPGWFRHEWIWVKNRGSNFLNVKREPMKEHEQVLVFGPGKWTYNPQMQERSETGKARIGAAYSPGHIRKTHAQTNVYRHMPNEWRRPGAQMRVPSSVQRFNGEKGLHPTQKPVSLFSLLVKTYTNPGETVLDPAMGSGTTGVACARSGRRFVGMELLPEHFAVAQKRIADAQAQLCLTA